MDKKNEKLYLMSVCKKYGVNPQKIITPEACGAALQSSYIKGMHDAYYNRADKSGTDIIRGLVELATAINQNQKDNGKDPVKTFIYTYLSALSVCEEDKDFISLVDFLTVFMDTTLMKNGKQPITSVFKQFKDEYPKKK